MRPDFVAVRHTFDETDLMKKQRDLSESISVSVNSTVLRAVQRTRRSAACRDRAVRGILLAANILH